MAHLNFAADEGTLREKPLVSTPPCAHDARHQRLQAGNATSYDQTQGSSLAKVLADYAAMPTNIEQGSPSTPKADEKRQDEAPVVAGASKTPREIGGREGPEPTRFGDWEKAGRCIDF